MLSVFERSTSELAARLVLLAMADHAHDDGSNAFAAVPTLARKARVAERTARRALRWAEREVEIVHVGETSRGVRIYHMAVVEPLAVTVEGGQYVPRSSSLLETGSKDGSGGAVSGVGGHPAPGPRTSTTLDEWIDEHAPDPDVIDADFFSQLNVRRVKRGTEEYDRAVRRWVEARPPRTKEDA